MAGLDLERMSVLVVEDSPFIRSLLINSLKILGVGKVVTKDHGGEAIEFIKLVHSDPMKAGLMTIDIIMSNWDMSPVDGMMLLRWVRRHKDSPDRYKPFVMITAYSEPNRVTEARDMGVTEFLTKPFTINAIAEKLTSIILHPRQFVHTKDYFGPDRRRQNLPFDGENRRKLTEESDEVEVIRV
ncbi:MAG: response regulator [Alphaproteobacteria bacterium]|nr:MAG: response regulator [Alphaproteobacteria bacterium]